MRIRARTDGFSVLPVDKAVAQSDLVLILLSDEIIPETFSTDIEPNLSPGSAIVFASGYNLAYGMLVPPVGIDVLLLAPRMAGENARQRFLNQQGYFAYVSVEQDASGKAWNRLLGLADAAGVLQAGALELNARQESDLDLYIEQTLGAVLGVAIMNAFYVGVEAGLPPEALIMEMFMSEEMEMVWRSFRQKGFFQASIVHGPTALFGVFIRTMQLMQTDLSAGFSETLEEIQSGSFAKQFQAERESGYPLLSQAQAMSMEDNPLTKAETRLRSIMKSSDH